MKDKIDIRPVLFLSTAHLSGPDVGNAFAHPVEYGWLWYSAADESDADGGEPIPECLRDCRAFAKSHGVEIIRFDCDCATVEGLPVYDW